MKKLLGLLLIIMSGVLALSGAAGQRQAGFTLSGEELQRIVGVDQPRIRQPRVTVRPVSPVGDEHVNQAIADGRVMTVETAQRLGRSVLTRQEAYGFVNAVVQEEELPAPRDVAQVLQSQRRRAYESNLQDYNLGKWAGVIVCAALSAYVYAQKMLPIQPKPKCFWAAAVMGGVLWYGVYTYLTPKPVPPSQ